MNFLVQQILGGVASQLKGFVPLVVFLLTAFIVVIALRNIVP